MAQLAIKGHETRGGEVIEILEMLGGKNTFEHYGMNTSSMYYVDKFNKNSIFCSPANEDSIIFTLEEFLEKFPYKIEDKVLYHEHKAHIASMRWDGEEVIYNVECKNKMWETTMFYLQPYQEETMESKPNLLQQLKEYFDKTPRDVLEKEWNELSYLNEIGPSVDKYLESVKKYRQSNQYPKTYEECCEVLNIAYPYFDAVDNYISASTYKNELFGKLKKLIICRDAYWKLAGEQRGLGKPWQPDYTDESYEQGSPKKYVIYYTGTYITKGVKCTPSHILAFPTEEMRDAFYENFKDLIESCKEFL